VFEALNPHYLYAAGFHIEYILLDGLAEIGAEGFHITVLVPTHRLVSCSEQGYFTAVWIQKDTIFNMNWTQLVYSISNSILSRMLELEVIVCRIN
jgi:hypothetical protein